MVTKILDAEGEPRRGDPYLKGCPTRRILDRIGDRWTVLVVGALSDGTARFSELRRRVDGISQKMLTQTLREMERDGLVVRTVYPEVPVRVQYELTEAGISLREPLKALEDWSVEHLGSVTESQATYDGQAPSRAEPADDATTRTPGTARPASN